MYLRKESNFFKIWDASGCASMEAGENLEFYVVYKRMGLDEKLSIFILDDIWKKLNVILK